MTPNPSGKFTYAQVSRKTPSQPSQPNSQQPQQQINSNGPKNSARAQPPAANLPKASNAASSAAPVSPASDTPPQQPKQTPRPASANAPSTPFSFAAALAKGVSNVGNSTAAAAASQSGETQVNGKGAAKAQSVVANGGQTAKGGKDTKTAPGVNGTLEKPVQFKPALLKNAGRGPSGNAANKRMSFGSFGDVHDAASERPVSEKGDGGSSSVSVESTDSAPPAAASGGASSENGAPAQPVPVHAATARAAAMQQPNIPRTMSAPPSIKQANKLAPATPNQAPAALPSQEQQEKPAATVPPASAPAPVESAPAQQPTSAAAAAQPTSLPTSQAAPQVPAAIPVTSPQGQLPRPTPQPHHIPFTGAPPTTIHQHAQHFHAPHQQQPHMHQPPHHYNRHNNARPPMPPMTSQPQFGGKPYKQHQQIPQPQHMPQMGQQAMVPQPMPPVTGGPAAMWGGQQPYAQPFYYDPNMPTYYPPTYMPAYNMQQFGHQMPRPPPSTPQRGSGFGGQHGFTPARGGAIKIVNPETNQEVKLPAGPSAPATPQQPRAPSPVKGGDTPKPTGAPLVIKNPDTGEIMQKRPSAAIKIVAPSESKKEEEKSGETKEAPAKEAAPVKEAKTESAKDEVAKVAPVKKEPEASKAVVAEKEVKKADKEEAPANVEAPKKESPKVEEVKAEVPKSEPPKEEVKPKVTKPEEVKPKAVKAEAPAPIAVPVKPEPKEKEEKSPTKENAEPAKPTSPSTAKPAEAAPLSSKAQKKKKLKETLKQADEKGSVGGSELEAFTAKKETAPAAPSTAVPVKEVLKEVPPAAPIPVEKVIAVVKSEAAPSSQKAESAPVASEAAQAKAEKPAKVEEKKVEEKKVEEKRVEEKKVEEKKVEEKKVEEAKPAPKVKSPEPEAEMEEGEIREQETKPSPPKEGAPGRRSASPVPDETPAPAAAKPSARAAPPGKLEMRQPIAMKRLESFEGVKYPSTIQSPSVSEDRKFRYNRDFLMQFAEVAKERPDALPSHNDIYGDDRVSSPRGDRRSSQGPGARGGAGMQRQGSASDRSGPVPQTSEERFSQHMAKRVSGVMGVMPGVVAPPGRMVRTGSGGGGVPPPISRQGSGYRGGRGDGRDRGGRGSRHQPPPTPQVALEPVEPLSKSQNAWAPLATKKLDLDEEEAAELLILRKVKGLLNKLTIEKFDPISDQILALGITTESILKSVISLIFEKAIDEPNFGSMYAQLCFKMSQELPKIQAWISEGQNRNNRFRRALLNKCQEEFEMNQKWAENDDNTLEERRRIRKQLESLSSEEKQKIAEADYERGKLKRRVLGNIAFIGELFMKSMLTEKIMHACVTQLLKNVKDPEEEDVESLCKLMTTVGARMDHEKGQAHMDAYFARIVELSTSQKLSSRIRFMLMDLIDLRKDGWKNRNAPAGPKTIAEIHAEAEKKAQEEAERIRLANQRSSGGGGRNMPTRDQQFGRGGDRRSRGASQSSGGGPSGDGWQVQGGRGGAQTRQTAGDMTSFGKLGAVKVDRSQMMLGPSGGPGFGLGAKGWSAKKGDDADKKGPGMSRTSSTGSSGGGFSNSFALLAEAGGDRKKSVDEGRKLSDKKAAPSPTPPAVKSPEPPKKLTKGQVKSKIDGMLREWFHMSDVNELIATFKEVGPENYEEGVSALLNGALEKKADLNQKTADAWVKLASEGLATGETFKNSLRDTIEFITDIAIDVPDVYKYVGMFVGRLVVADLLTFSDILELAQPIVDSKDARPPLPKLLAEVLSNIKSVDGEEKMVELYKAQVDLKAFWPKDKAPTDEVLAEWMRNAGLFALEPQLEVVKELKYRLSKDDAESIADWLETAVPENVRSSPAFVRTLTSSILRHVAAQTVFPNGPAQPPVEPTSELYTKQTELLKGLKPLFDRYVKDADAKVEVLFAAQAYCAEVSFPKELLQNLFRLFYDLDIADEPAHQAWKNNTTSETGSKKEASKALAGWFKYLEDQS